MKKLLFLLLMTGVTSISVHAQTKSTFSIQYSMGSATGDSKEFVSTTSFRGAALEYRYYVQDNLSVGIDAGWNTFYERRAYDTYTSGSVSLSGTQYRYINSAPIYLGTDYYFSPGQKMNPFVGLGIGTLFTRRNTDMGLYTLEYDSWAFALRPEAGVLVNANSDLDFILVAKYNGGFATEDLQAQSYLTFNIGVVFK